MVLTHYRAMCRGYAELMEPIELGSSSFESMWCTLAVQDSCKCVIREACVPFCRLVRVCGCPTDEVCLSDEEQWHS